MEPITVGAFVAAANLTIKLAEVSGLLRDEVKEFAKDTNVKVNALLERDFNVALSMLEVSAHALDGNRQAALVAKALDRFENAEATAGLDEYFRGFAAAMCAALAIRLRNDGEEARHWSAKAVEHYDAAIREIHGRGEAAAKARDSWEKYKKGTHVVGVPIFSGGFAVVDQVLRRKAEMTARLVPRHGLVAAINAQNADAHCLAQELEVDLAGRALAVEVTRTSEDKYVTKSCLRTVPKF